MRLLLNPVDKSRLVLITRRTYSWGFVVLYGTIKSNRRTPRLPFTLRPPPWLRLPDLPRVRSPVWCGHGVAPRKGPATATSDGLHIRHLLQPSQLPIPHLSSDLIFFTELRPLMPLSSRNFRSSCASGHSS